MSRLRDALLIGSFHNKDECRSTTRCVWRDRLLRLRAGAFTRASSRSQETAALLPAAQRRECWVQRFERSLSATGGQRRISIREVLVAADETCRGRYRVPADAARVLARVGPRGRRARLARDRSERGMAFEAVSES